METASAAAGGGGGEHYRDSDDEGFLSTGQSLSNILADLSTSDEGTLNVESEEEYDGDYTSDDHLLEQYLPQIWGNNGRNIAEAIDYFRLAHLGNISSMLTSSDSWVGGAGDEYSGHSREHEFTSFQCLIYALSNFGAIDEFDPECLWSSRPRTIFAEQLGISRAITCLQQSFQMPDYSSYPVVDPLVIDPQGIAWPDIVPYMTDSKGNLIPSESGASSILLPPSDSYEGVYQIFNSIVEAFNSSRHEQYQPTQQQIREELSRNLSAFFDSGTIDLVLDTVLSSYFTIGTSSDQIARPHERQRRKSRTRSFKNDEDTKNHMQEMNTRSICRLYRKYLFSSYKAYPVSKRMRNFYSPSAAYGSNYYTFDSMFSKARPVPGHFFSRDMLISPSGLGKSYFSDHSTIRLFDFNNDGNGPICMSRPNSRLCSIAASSNCLIGCSTDGSYGIETRVGILNGIEDSMRDIQTPVCEGRIPSRNPAGNLEMPVVSHVEMSLTDNCAVFATTAGTLEILDIKAQKFISSINIRRLCKSDTTMVSHTFGILDNSASASAHLVAGPTRAMVIDLRTEDLALPLGNQNNRQYTCSSAWSPDSVYAAIGTQSHSCMLFDIRKPHQPLFDFVGNLGAMRNVQFDRKGQFLAAAEPVDCVHVLSLDGITEGIITTDSVSERHQVVEFWGDIAGLSFTDSASLLVGISDVSVGGILDYIPLCQRYDVVDSICL